MDQTRRSRRNIVMNDSGCGGVISEESGQGLDTSIISYASSNGGGGGYNHSSLNISGSTSFLALNSQFRDSRRSSYSVLPNASSSSSSTDQPLSLVSRTSSIASLSNLSNQGEVKRTPIKIFAKCLRSDIEYKTLSVSRHTTSTEVIWMLLSKFKMKHRDPKLFYLTMDIGIISHGGSSGPGGDSFTRTLVLEDDAYPAELKSCHPWGECRFTLQMRKGGLVRVHDSVLMAESKYKCLLISDNTTVNEVVSILFHCYGLERIERVDRYQLCEVGPDGHKRKLEAEDCPVNVQASWPQPSYKFVLRRSSVPSFKTSTLLQCRSTSNSLSVSTNCQNVAVSGGAGGAPAENSEYATVMDTSGFSHASSESPVPRSPSCSSQSGSSVSPTGSVMSATSGCSSSSGSDDSSTSSSSASSSIFPPPPPQRPLPLVPRYASEPTPPPPPPPSSMVPNLLPPGHHRQQQHQMNHPPQPKANFNLNGPVTAFPAAPATSSGGGGSRNFHFPRGLHSRLQTSGAIHECGLPAKTAAAAATGASDSGNAMVKFSSLQSIGPRTRVAFHDYENYFYI